VNKPGDNSRKFRILSRNRVEQKSLASRRGFLFVGLFWCVQEIVGGIRHADFLASVGSVAAGRGCFATLGVEALDGRDAREQSITLVADDIDK
jgi:hypothetical protein